MLCLKYFSIQIIDIYFLARIFLLSFENASLIHVKSTFFFQDQCVAQNCEFSHFKLSVNPLSFFCISRGNVFILYAGHITIVPSGIYVYICLEYICVQYHMVPYSDISTERVCLQMIVLYVYDAGWTQFCWANWFGSYF
jgi:hypothetical protein